MNYDLDKKALKVLRKLYAKSIGAPIFSKPQSEMDVDKVSQIMFEQLVRDEPCMIARFGAFELTTVVNYLGVRKNDRSFIRYIKGESLQWWWNKKTLFFMENTAGFFPASEEKAAQFSELMLEDLKQLDILGSWLEIEQHFMVALKEVVFVQREIQNPFFTENPWTMALEGKRVLVVHPFSDLIESQFANRELLFENPKVLPAFELQTLKAVQSFRGENNQFKNWFEALQYMKDEIDKRDYDICLIGCGAYGFPLAAHVKRQGKKSVHLGGSLQLLFGIKGKRWENPNYHKIYNYAALMNEYWVRPGEKFRPRNAENIEGGGYW